MFLEELSTPLSALFELTSLEERNLVSLGITTGAELLLFWPSRYIDRTAVLPLSAIGEKGRSCTVIKVLKVSQIRGRRRFTRIEIESKTDKATLYLFGQFYAQKMLIPGNYFFLDGQFQRKNGALMSSNFYCEAYGPAPESFKRVVPLYRGGERPMGEDASKFFDISKRIGELFERYGSLLEDPLPQNLASSLGLPGFVSAAREMHVPSSLEALEKARERVKTDEIFFFEMTLRQSQMKTIRKERLPLVLGSDLAARAEASLPFTLTGGQHEALKEIAGDMSSSLPMKRLLQGDVGCGKTLVALLSALWVIEKGYQVVFMAPTTLLAQQHYARSSALLAPLGVKVLFLSGSLRTQEKKDALQAARSGVAQLIVGTHAVFSEGAEYKNLRYVIIDEQHRFGVRQRAEIVEKGHDADLLVMTATPIPRSLALTFFSDLDLTSIKELPEGRRPIETHVVSEAAEAEVFDFAQSEVEQGHGVYIVTPLIEEGSGARKSLASVKALFKRVQERFGQDKCGMLHSKLSSEEQRRVTREFESQKIFVLVATTMVEVGVDVSSATVMIVESAQQFGLSVLHQLRGRVGRSELPSKCFLVFKEESSQDAKERLEILESSQDGFYISQKDFERRGPGEMIGLRQAGFIPFKIASMTEDSALMQKLRQSIDELLGGDPALEKPEHERLARYLTARRGEQFTPLIGG